jgi:hypothetical protein
MRGLEPPRGSETSGGTWRHVEDAGLSWLRVTGLRPCRVGFVDSMWTKRRALNVTADDIENVTFDLKADAMCLVNDTGQAQRRVGRDRACHKVARNWRLGSTNPKTKAANVC